MHFSVITLFPEIFESPLAHSIIRRAREKKLLAIDLVDLRQYAHDRHRTADDYPYGGGQGMVLKPEPLIEAIEDCRRRLKDPRVVLLSPRGRVFDQRIAAETSRRQEVVLVCGRYEGVDERVVGYTDDVLSVGDYTLSGGEIPALAVIDTVARLVPGGPGQRAVGPRGLFRRRPAGVPAVHPAGGIPRHEGPGGAAVGRPRGGAPLAPRDERRADRSAAPGPARGGAGRRPSGGRLRGAAAPSGLRPARRHRHLFPSPTSTSTTSPAPAAPMESGVSTWSIR